MVMGVVGVRTSCSAVLKSEYEDVEGMVAVVEGIEVEGEEEETEVFLRIEEEEDEEKQ